MRTISNEPGDRPSITSPPTGFSRAQGAQSWCLLSRPDAVAAITHRMGAAADRRPPTADVIDVSGLPSTSQGVGPF